MQRLRFTPHFHQAFAHHRVFQTVGAVKIPGVAGTTRAAARFMVWQVRASTRIVSLLGFPGHQTVFDVDFPAAGAGAVYPVGRADDFVMLPTLAISILPVTVGIEKLAMPIGKGFTLLFEVAKPVQEFTHRFSPVGACRPSDKSTLLMFKGKVTL